MIVERHRWKVASNRRLPGLRFIRGVVESVLRREKKAGGDVQIIFTGKEPMKALHKKFLHDASETDVMAFPLPALPGERKNLFRAEIYVCVPVAAENAVRHGQPFEKEIVRLIVHGLLHLSGYDDHSQRRRRVMWSRQEEIVNRVWNRRNS